MTTLTRRVSDAFTFSKKRLSILVQQPPSPSPSPSEQHKTGGPFQLLPYPSGFLRGGIYGLGACSLSGQVVINLSHLPLSCLERVKIFAEGKVRLDTGFEHCFWTEELVLLQKEKLTTPGVIIKDGWVKLWFNLPLPTDLPASQIHPSFEVSYQLCATLTKTGGAGELKRTEQVELERFWPLDAKVVNPTVTVTNVTGAGLNDILEVEEEEPEEGIWFQDRNSQVHLLLPKESLLLTPQCQVPVAVQVVSAVDSYAVMVELHEIVFNSVNSTVVDDKVLATAELIVEAKNSAQSDHLIILTCPAADEFHPTTNSSVMLVVHRLVVRLELDQAGSTELRLVQPCVITRHSLDWLREVQKTATASELREAQRGFRAFRSWAKVTTATVANGRYTVAKRKICPSLISSQISSRPSTARPSTARPSTSIVPTSPTSQRTHHLSLSGDTVIESSPQVFPVEDIQNASQGIIKEFEILPLEGKKGLVSGFHGLGQFQAKVTGKIKLNLRHPVCARSIHVQLIGTVWCKTPSNFERTLIDQTETLWKGQGDVTNMHQGEWEFAIPLEPSLPESCKLNGKRGGVRYVLRVGFTHVGPFGLVEHQREKEAEVVRCLLPHSPLAKKEIILHGIHSPGNFSYTLSLNSGRVYAPGQLIKITAQLHSHNYERVPLSGLVRVELVEHVRYVHRPDPEVRETRILSRKDVQFRGEEEAILELQRPLEADPTVEEAGGLFQVRHCLRYYLQGITAAASTADRQSVAGWIPVVLSDVPLETSAMLVERVSELELEESDIEWLQPLLEQPNAWWW